MRTGALDSCHRHAPLVELAKVSFYAPRLAKKLGLTPTGAYDFLCSPKRHAECGAGYREAADLAAEYAQRELRDLCIAARAQIGRKL